MRLAHSALFAGILSTGLLTGCNESSFFVKGDPEPPAPENGVVQGRVCDPSGRTWLADALVYTHLTTSDGRIIETATAYSDRDGFWYIDSLPPEREYTFYVQYGDDLIETHTLWVDDGDEVALEEPDCFDPLQLDVAVVAGDYDNFDFVLDDMGFANYYVVNGLLESELSTFLMDLEAMNTYDIIFLNGGHVEENIIYDLEDSDAPAQVATIRQNLFDYVQAGGTLYASDWAYDAVETVWPDRIEWVGDDAVPDDAQHGEYDLVTANIRDAAMADWLGRATLDVEFDLPVWPPMESVDGSVTTHLEGNISYRIGTSSYNLAQAPIMASFTSGEGRVVFSSFRVAKNGTSDMLLLLQYMMYNL
ncbi:MAG: hypothetical protein VX000_04310 [Myxococcota bacterium]|nr:hypothetical protein [Myxococcota bacterium]